MQRATIIAILVATVVLFLLDGLYYGLLMQGMQDSMPEAYKAALNKTEPPMYAWLVTELLASVVLWLVVARNPERPINVKSAAMTSSLVWALVSAMFSYFFILMIADWPMQGELMSFVWAGLTGGIAGYVLAFTHNKLSKA